MIHALRTAAQRVGNSVAYRSATLYGAVLGCWLPSAITAKETLPITYLAFCGKAHLSQLRESIASLGRTWESLPQLLIVSDGTVNPERVRDVLRFWPAVVDVVDWRDLTAEVRDAGHSAVVRFAERVPMARKMVAVASSALHGPTLYADVDVLWFRTPAVAVEAAAYGGVALVMSPDYLATYDSSLVPVVLPHLAKAPYCCAGIMYAKGDFLTAAGVGELLDFAAERGVAVTEQTVFAEVNHRLGKQMLPESEFALFEDDRFSLGLSFPGKPWAARHYVGQVRHIFWRDALGLRIGLR